MRTSFSIFAAVLFFGLVSISQSANAAWAPPPGPGAGPGNPLSRYSDRALLQELGYRGYTCTYQAPAAAAVVNIVCDQYSNMNFELYNSAGELKSGVRYFMSSTARCQTERTRILGETENGRLYQDKTIAFCDPYTNMLKLRFTSSMINEVEKTFMSSDANCSANADQFNSLF